MGGRYLSALNVVPNSGINLTAVGKINLDNLLQFNEGRPTDAARFWTKYIHGSTDWRAVVKIQDKTGDKGANVLIKSSLQGLVSDFPEPFSKSSTDIVPLIIEKNIINLKQSLMKINYGKQVSAKIVFSNDDVGKYHTEQGLILFGSSSAKLPRSGVLLAGELPKLQLDEWM